jgi:hypothetical protein
MEITFVWSWLSFWIGFASVFVSAFILMFVLAISASVKRSKANQTPVSGSLDDLISWRKER